MKKHILILLATVLSLSSVSCMKEIARLEPYPRNVGEEYLEVVPDTSLTFQGRGGTLSLSVKASYDGTIEATADWAKLSAPEFPGDQRQFKVEVVTEANKSENDRQCEIIVRTPNLSKKIAVFQPKYNRPAFVTNIKTADEFVAFIENATYVEENEAVTIEQTIDLKDVTLPEGEYFNGVLDGKGNNIINLKSGHSLFNELKEKAVVKNLIFSNSCQFEIPATTNAFGTVVSENYGTVEGCVNDGAITAVGERTSTLNMGAFVAFNRATGKISNSKNNGKLTFDPINSTSSVYIGGIVAQNIDGTIELCENSGVIYADPSSMTGIYNIGGIAAGVNADKSTVAGTIKGCIVHKEGDIFVGKQAGTSKGYIGSALGRVEGHPVMSAIETYADVEVLIEMEYYVGALQAWQGAVNDGVDYTFFENSIVNTNIIAYTKGKGQYGNNPCLSAGFVTGRFSGQKDLSSTLHYGNETNPIKVSGSITSIQTGTKVVAASKDYQALLDGDGSATSVNGAHMAKADYNTIKYEVVGDGQTGPAEELILTIDGLKLEVPQTGGKTSFLFKANYDAVATAQAEWLYLDEAKTIKTMTFPVVDEKQTVAVYAAENPKTTDRSGKVSVELPNGSYGDVEILQPGNKTLPAELEVSATELEPLPEGSDVTFNVTANYDATVTTDVDWLTVDPVTVVGDYKANPVKVTAKANDASGATDREATVTVTVKELTKTVTIKQKKFEFIPKGEIGTVKDFMDFVKYADNPSLYPADMTIKLTADIDLKGQTLTPISTFAATFDGDGHSLKNWACDGPLFAKINGDGAAVKNLVIDESCTVKLKFENATVNGDNRCMGVICGDLLNGSIEGCTNNANVELASFGDNPTFVGAIAGRTQAGKWVKNCINNGSVTVKPTSQVTKSYRIAGIVAGSNGNMEKCINNAPVEYSPADIQTSGNAYTMVGGVAAYLASKTAILTGCVNKGKVTFNPGKVTSITPESAIGGVLAYLAGQIISGKFSENKNFGDIYCTAADENISAGGLLGCSHSGSADNHLLDENSVVNCNITAAFATPQGLSSANPCASAGLIIGRVALKDDVDNVTGVIGTADTPVKVAGSITLIGGSTVAADGTNFKDLTHGSKLTVKFDKDLPAPPKLAIYAEYSEVTPEK